jgi:CRP-like cAMP-binding protein
MLGIASLAHEVSLVPGVPLFTDAEGPTIYAMLDGQVTVEDEGGTIVQTAGSGDVIGAFETLAGTHVRGKVSATTAGRALRIEREDLLDLFGQRPLLLQQVFGALFRSRPAAPVAA